MQLVPHGKKIALTDKRNNLCNYNARSSLEKTTARKLLQIYRGNDLQVAFTPIKSVKLPIVKITYQVTPFLNNVSFFESFCSFKVGRFTAINKVVKRPWHY